jgi:hypothetical protein
LAGYKKGRTSLKFKDGTEYEFPSFPELSIEKLLTAQRK